jgi:Fe-S cluster biogenesis protein NfuA
VRDKIEALFRDVLDPLIAADGGSIKLVDVRNDSVIIRMEGAYRGCPSVHYTVQGVIEPAVRKAVGRELRVEVVV